MLFRSLKKFTAHKLAMIGVAIIALEVFLVVFLPIILKLDPYTSDILAFSAKPGPGHLLGTDDTGRDVFARLVYGGRVSLLVGLLSAIISPVSYTHLDVYKRQLLYLRKQAKYTLMVTISLLPVSEGLSTPWPVILAGTTLVIIPIIVLYLILQTFQKSGMMAGAVKG